MTPAEIRRVQQQAAREERERIKAEQRAAREQAAAQKRAKQEAARAERERQRTINTAIRTGGRVATSRLGQDIIRGVFGTLFGRK
jgi:hypothetical protein